MPSNATGSKQLGEDLDPVDHPRPGQDERTAVDDEHPVVADRAQVRPALRPRRGLPGPGRLGERESVGEQHQHLRVHVPDGIPRGLLGWAAVLAEELPAAGEAHLVRDPAADGPRRIDGTQQHDPWRLEPVIAAPHDDLLEALEPLAQAHHDVERRVLGLGHRADRHDAVEHAFDGRRRQRQHGRRLVLVVCEDRLHRACADGALLAIAHDDEVRVCVEEGAGIQLVTLDTGSRQDRDLAHAGRDPAPVGDAHQLHVQPEGDHDLRGGRQEGDDAHAASLRARCCWAMRCDGSPTRERPRIAAGPGRLLRGGILPARG